MIWKLTGILGASALAAAPIAAQVSARASAPVRQASGITADQNLVFYLGIAAVAAGIVLLVEDDDDAPISED